MQANFDIELDFSEDDCTYRVVGNWWDFPASPRSYSSAGDPPESGIEFEFIERVKNEYEEEVSIEAPEMEWEKNFNQTVWDALEEQGELDI